ncbi:hypothetical protein [Candidatus Poriferisodalis sp.]|uniref:hypothetical protein n=1 Tax=Candidatus Poriferisodalis sp. TaxID=3101277 RepID=UPI003B52BC3E
MTHAANVLSGYVLATIAVLGYASWVVRRGRVLGRGLGVDRSAPRENSDPASIEP